ncbi:C2/PLDc/PLD_C/PLDc_2 domain-containing protein [Cinnamomum micranthum f. kanehirae]|uniref:Phospholipase D n=1 Tax=Cinnamomum micranthum f. kanehirae TaxID=337451 RepID=A0A443PNL9_9MAGN|nr:C2/PLDc/PLD_C/PLDc_2 domain-containing protein [Cinnamomum micranthum f. kanehirae]
MEQEIAIREVDNCPDKRFYSTEISTFESSKQDTSQHGHVLRAPPSLLRPCRSAISSASGSQKKHHHKIITSDPYVTVCLAGATIVKDNDIFGAQLIGIASIPVDAILSETLLRTGSQFLLQMEILPSRIFTPFESNPEYQRSIAADPEKKGVQGTYFPVRKGGMVTLYQGCTCADGTLPEIELDNGKVSHHEKCWRISAMHLGSTPFDLYCWVVNLPQGETRSGANKNKAVATWRGANARGFAQVQVTGGVRVLILVWDDKTSHNKSLSKRLLEGVMATHDEETRKFFKHSSMVGTLFTHHQKCVLVDTQAGGNNRKITAFIGGLDLCDGRYDTPEHRLYRDLDIVFKDDYHNPTFPTGKGPRQPWHDLHCKIEGPAAYDVLKNFEQRWKKATKWQEFGRCFERVSRWQDDALIKLERISWILSPCPPSIPDDDPTLWESSEDDPENWHVQVFRSIDSGSVKGFPNTAKEAEAQNLFFGKNLVIDKSIHTAYVKAIRSAQHFIYIENQYFLGSSFGWPSYKNTDADNLVPVELALKIVSKIRAKERFAVYIVIPMWPEGDPTSASVQEILFWQSQTIQMMYNIVAQELKSMDLKDSHPQDYLNFYCLGNREEPQKVINQSTNQPPQNGGKALPRFMIYVHAKGMIVDDEYVLLGSANINQRSLDGSRDTEIAMGAYQQHHAWARKNKHPRGQVYGYRMSLWSEHLGNVDDCFKEIKDPQSLECVKLVNGKAEENWRRYVAEETTTLEGHLLKYPIKVEADGKVGPLPGCENFPDVGGKVLGTHSASLPDALTM